MDAGLVVADGDMAWPKVPPIDGLELGVLAAIVLLLDRGRTFGVDCRFCVCNRGGFLIVERGRAMEDLLLGVADVPAVAALKLRGAVIEPKLSISTAAERLISNIPFWEVKVPLCGVAGAARGVPSLVVGRLPFDNAEAGRAGGPIDSPLLKKLDLLRPLLPAGDEGSWDRLSIVRSDREGRDCPTAGLWASTSFSNAYSDSFPLNPARELAREDALEADRNASKSPSTSVSFVPVEGFGGCELVRDCRDGGRPIGFLKTEASATEFLAARLGMERLVDSTDVLFELVFTDAGGTMDDRARDVREGLFCSDGGGWGACEMEDSEDLLCSGG